MTSAKIRLYAVRLCRERVLTRIFDVKRTYYKEKKSGLFLFLLFFNDVASEVYLAGESVMN